MRRLCLLAIASLACATTTAPEAQAQPEFALYLLRHAEKTEEPDDPVLDGRVAYLTKTRRAANAEPEEG